MVITDQRCSLTDGVLVFVGVNAGVDHVVKQIMHDVSQSLGVQHTVQCSNEHRLLRLESLRRLANVVAVTQNPRNHLYLTATNVCQRVPIEVNKNGKWLLIL